MAVNFKFNFKLNLRRRREYGPWPPSPEGFKFQLPPTRHGSVHHCTFSLVRRYTWVQYQGTSAYAGWHIAVSTASLLSDSDCRGCPPLALRARALDRDLQIPAPACAHACAMMAPVSDPSFT
jgi:hypothetical protein